MAVSLCIHGHFYQPPREDPWLGSILTEASAAPMRHWNERILRESYAPLAWARRLDAEGRITDILNCYEWISFNAGPTLLHWMNRVAPGVVDRMREGDAQSRARWGHGNALAQTYHHIIMPLASAEDKDIETQWAIDDFRYYFGRDPEGMWLSECAVDLPTLDCLAAKGIQYVILAPRQAKAVVVNGEVRPVDEGSVKVGEPYTIALPSGRSIIAVFYHGRLSQSIAFEGLLRNGEMFWQRITGEAGALAAHSGVKNPLLTIATDGETYGHHFTFGEMALAYVLSQGYHKRDSISLTNLGAHIAANPPQCEALIHEPSSWSCVHGVERWRSNCGCSDGGHGDWNQAWRGPLREALNLMREHVTAHYAAVGAKCLTDPSGAVLAYGEVLADPGKRDDFARAWIKGGEAEHDTAWKLLAMQEQSLAAFASCAWFFDDISRIEPENGMTYALRAMELMRETGGSDCMQAVLDVLQKAQSNLPRQGSGRDIFMNEVLPRRDDAATLCLLAWLLLESRGALPKSGSSCQYTWPATSVELFPDTQYPPSGEQDVVQSGRAVIRGAHERKGTEVRWRLTPPSHTHIPGQKLVPLAECSIEVEPEGTPTGILRKSPKDFSRPMRDYLVSLLLENRERQTRADSMALAAHTVSMIEPWAEAQHDVPRSDLWVGFIPYLVPECMMNDAITEKQREQIETVLRQHLSDRAKSLARMLVRDIFLAALSGGASDTRPLSESSLAGRSEGPPFTCTDTPEPDPHLKDLSRGDAALATWAARVNAMMPDMDWWAVQNRVWEHGLGGFPQLARELRFR